MKKSLHVILIQRFILLALLAITCFISAPVYCADSGFPTTPQLNNGKKWRIGYYQGGGYIDYAKYTRSTIQALMDLGWIQKSQLPPMDKDKVRPLWTWLATKAHSKYLDFVHNAFYSADWDQQKRKEVSAELIDRLKNTKDIDLMLALGTWAGQDLATTQHSTPTIVISASDPVGAGIIKSAQDSGLPYVNARVDPNRYYRQVKIFHDIIGFQTLGVAYEDTKEGRTYAALKDIQRAAKNCGFKICSCHTLSDIPDQKKANASVITCYKKLSQQADAIYVTVQSGVNSDTLPKLVTIFNKNKIPTFSQAGSQEVRAGLLLSISQADYNFAGRFWATTIAKVFNGAQPGELTQVCAEPPNIAINIKTAETIGFNPPVDVLGAADKIFQKIETP